MELGYAKIYKGFLRNLKFFKIFSSILSLFVAFVYNFNMIMLKFNIPRYVDITRGMLGLLLERVLYFSAKTIRDFPIRMLQ